MEEEVVYPEIVGGGDFEEGVGSGGERVEPFDFADDGVEEQVQKDIAEKNERGDQVCFAFE